MIKAFSFSKNKLIEIKPEDIVKDKKSLFWIDLENSNSKEISSIKKIFDIHPTTEEDILSNQTRTKYEEFEENTSVIIQTIKRVETINIKTYNLSFISGENYLITSHSELNENITYLINNQKKLENLIKKGTTHIFHYLLDKEVDKCMQIKAILFEEFKKLERKFVSNLEKEVFEDLFKKELTLLEMRQIMESLTDLCLILTKSGDNYIDNELLPYFRDIYDHSFRTTESLKSILGRISGMRNAYQLIISNKLNEAMRNLTIIMAIMMPLTIITGYYGMNIKLPFQEVPTLWGVLLLLMTGISILMFFLFRKMNLNMKD